MKWKEKGGQPSKRALNAQFWPLLLRVAGQVWGHFQNDVPLVLVGPSCRGGLGWLDKFVVPVCWSASCKHPAGIHLGRRPEGSWLGRAREGVSCGLSVLQIRPGLQRPLSSCSYNFWISCEFLTAVLMHLNGNLRRSTVCVRWLIKIRQSRCYPELWKNEALPKITPLSETVKCSSPSDINCPFKKNFF